MQARQMIFCALLAVGFATAQELQVSGAVTRPLNLTMDELAKLPRATLETKRAGIGIMYEGVWLHELLKKAGAPSGASLRGKALASYLVAEAKDGYQVVFALAEFDPAFTDRGILVADRANGQPLIGEQGPLRLVVPNEKLGARSIRMLRKLEVVALRK